MEAEQAIVYAVRVPAGRVELAGDLALPKRVRGIVLFAHGSGSSRHSPRNRQVAAALQRAGYATLLMDLLTADEEQLDQRTRELRFDIAMLADRVIAAVDWLGQRDETRRCPWPSSAPAPVPPPPWSRRRTGRTAYAWSSRAAAGPTWPATRSPGCGRRPC